MGRYPTHQQITSPTLAPPIDVTSRRTGTLSLPTSSSSATQSITSKKASLATPATPSHRSTGRKSTRNSAPSLEVPQSRSSKQCPQRLRRRKMIRTTPRRPTSQSHSNTTRTTRLEAPRGRSTTTTPSSLRSRTWS